MSRRLVFDTSTLVSAALSVESVPNRALLEAMRSWDLCASTATLEELERVFDRAKFDAWLPRIRRREFVGLIRRTSHLFVVDEVHLQAVAPRCRDPFDDKFLALARAAEAEMMVGSDKDLLVLSPWRGIPIMSPTQFLQRTGSER